MRRWFINWIKTYRTAAWVSWAVVVFVLHAFPGKYIPQNHWMDLVALDKWIHAIMFFVGVYIVQHSWSKRFYALIIVLAYAFALELYQLLVASYRSFDWMDLLADGVGALLALFL